LASLHILDIGAVKSSSVICDEDKTQKEMLRAFNGVFLTDTV